MKFFSLAVIVLLSLNANADYESLCMCYNDCSEKFTELYKDAKSERERMEIRQEVIGCYDRCNFLESLCAGKYR